MATLNVVTLKNKKSGSVDLNSTVFEAPVRTDLIHAEVRRQLASRRSGTHSSKNREATTPRVMKSDYEISRGSGREQHGLSPFFSPR